MACKAALLLLLRPEIIGRLPLRGLTSPGIQDNLTDSGAHLLPSTYCNDHVVAQAPRMLPLYQVGRAENGRKSHCDRCQGFWSPLSTLVGRLSAILLYAVPYQGRTKTLGQYYQHSPPLQLIDNLPIAAEGLQIG